MTDQAPETDANTILDGANLAPAPTVETTSIPAPSDAGAEAASTTPASVLPETVAPTAPVVLPVAAPSTPAEPDTIVVPASENLSTPPTPETPAASDQAQTDHKGAVAYLESAIKNALTSLEKDGVIAVHGIENEYRTLKSFADYQLHALKGKLGLL